MHYLCLASPPRRDRGEAEIVASHGVVLNCDLRIEFTVAMRGEKAPEQTNNQPTKPVTLGFIEGVGGSQARASRATEAADPRRCARGTR